MTEVAQLELLEDEAAASAAASEGMERARRAERVQVWKLEAAAWLITRVPGSTLTADDVVRAVGLPDQGPARNNVVGAWISSMAHAGHLIWTGDYAKSKRAVGHGNLQRIWRVA